MLYPKSKLIIVCLLLITTTVYGKQYGSFTSVDSSFGTNGIATSNCNNANAILYASTAMQGDNKILIAGCVKQSSSGKWQFAVTRFNENGTIDNSFGTSGTTTTNFGTAHDTTTAIAVQPDGKIVVGGYTREMVGSNTNTKWAIARFNTDGTLDATFGTGGKVLLALGTTDAHLTHMVVTKQNKIIVGGYRTSGFNPFAGRMTFVTIAGLTTSGNIDYAFGYNNNGFILLGDTSAGNSTNLSLGALALSPDHSHAVAVCNGDPVSGLRIVSNYDFITTTGMPTPTSHDFISFFDYSSQAYWHTIATAATVQNDGKILVGGYATFTDFSNKTSYTPYITRYNADGTWNDHSFYDHGIPDGFLRLGTYLPTTSLLSLGANDTSFIMCGYDIRFNNRPFSHAEISRDGNNIGDDCEVHVNTDAAPMYMQLQGSKLIIGGVSVTNTSNLLTVVRYKNSSATSGGGTGIASNSITFSHLSIYPNPACQNTVNISLTMEKNDEISILVNSIDGKQQLQIHRAVKAGDNKIQLDIATLTAGIYTITAKGTDGTTIVEKFVKY